MAINDKMALIGGAGTMGTALVKGLLQAKATSPEQIHVTSRHDHTLAHLEPLGVTLGKDNRAAVTQATLVVICVLAVANIPRCLYWGRPGQAFASSSAVIASLTALFGVALFPNLVTASNDPALSVTIFNAASSAKTLGIMLIIAAIGMPFVLAYTTVVYWVFRGKVKLGELSY